MQDDHIKRLLSSFPRTKKRSTDQYPSAVRESPDARGPKAKYLKYQRTHPLRSKSGNRKAYDNDVTSLSRHVLLIAA
jgi:hypothetical protein